MSDPVDSAGNGNAWRALEAAAGRPTGRWGQRIATGTAVWSIVKMARQYVRNQQTERRYTITVMESDAIYGEVHSRVLDLMPAPAQRSLVAHTSSVRSSVPMDDFDGPSAFNVTLRYDGTRTQTILLEGHRVHVVVDREDGKGASSDGMGSSYRSHKLVFTAADMAGRGAVVRFLQSCADTLASGKRQPLVVTTGRWGDWRPLKDVPLRQLDSVILPAGHLDALRADLERFLSWERAYARLGRPWHRGYLFYGPPGTGKSSLAQALAGHYGMNVYVLPLSDIEQDSTITNLVAGVPARSVLLLEDVDVAHAATDRDDDRKGVTLAGLLNVLDGVGTPHGLVTILTTNHEDRLDPALTRPGRVDYTVHLDYLVKEQAERIVEYATGLPFTAAMEPDGKLTAADLMGELAANLDDVHSARIAAAQLLAGGFTAGPEPRTVRCACEDPATCAMRCPLEVDAVIHDEDCQGIGKPCCSADYRPATS
jgi:hypothetical protein